MLDEFVNKWEVGEGSFESCWEKGFGGMIVGI